MQQLKGIATSCALLYVLLQITRARGCVVAKIELFSTVLCLRAVHKLGYKRDRGQFCGAQFKVYLEAVNRCNYRMGFI